MNRAERERLIERYMCGEMSAAQESDFFIQVALDKELRQELKAQHVIESALRKDLESEATEHTAMRSRVAATLAGNPAAGSSARAMASMAAPVAAARPRPAQRRRWLMAPLQWVAASALALALTMGTVIVLPSGGSTEQVSPTQEQTDGSARAKEYGKIQHRDAQRPEVSPEVKVQKPAALPGDADVKAPAAVENSAPVKPASGAPVRSESVQRNRTRENAPAHTRVTSTRADNANRSAADRPAVDRSTAVDSEPAAASEGAKSDEPLKVGITVQIPKKVQQP